MRISDWSSDVCSSDLLHSIWQDLAQTAASRDFVIVTDYPKGEQRPHKFKIAMVIFAVTMLIALSSKIPTSIALMAGVAGMLVSGVLKMDEAYSAINWKTVFLMACLIPLDRKSTRLNSSH